MPPASQYHQLADLPQPVRMPLHLAAMSSNLPSHPETGEAIQCLTKKFAHIRLQFCSGYLTTGHHTVCIHTSNRYSTHKEHCSVATGKPASYSNVSKENDQRIPVIFSPSKQISERLNTMESEGCLNNIYRFNSYLTENTMHLYMTSLLQESQVPRRKSSNYT